MPGSEVLQGRDRARMRPLLACVVGTRPEAVKARPSDRSPQTTGIRASIVRVITTGQHRGLLDQAAPADFRCRVRPRPQPDAARPEDLVDLSARALVSIADALTDIRPDLVLAQGDTTTVLCTALACHYRRVPFAHVEAGLRTGRSFDPFPEEKNRVLATHLADLHFAPTARARPSEPVARGSGSRIDPYYRATQGSMRLRLGLHLEKFDLPCVPPTRRFVLVTAHRRESFGAPLERICEALRRLVDRHVDPQRRLSSASESSASARWWSRAWGDHEPHQTHRACWLSTLSWDV